MTDPRQSALPVWRFAVGLAAAPAATALAAFAALTFEQGLEAPALSLVFVAPVVLCAIGFGFTSSILAAVMGAAAINFLFIEPRHTFFIHRAADAWAIGLFLFIAVLTSTLAAAARSRALDALERARQAEAIRDYARRLAAASGLAEVMSATAEVGERVLGRPTFVVDAERRVWPGGEGGAGPDIEAAEWAFAAKRHLGSFEDWEFWPIFTPTASLGVLAARGEATRSMEVAAEQIAALAAVALERLRTDSEAAEARIEAMSERTKTLLLAGVSHDLRTPVASLVLALQSLRRFNHPRAERAAMLERAEADAQRLARIVEGLMDMTRIEAGAVPVRPVPVAISDVVGAAVSDAGAALEGRRVKIELPADLPPVMADAALTERALANLLDNAGRYAPEGSLVTIGGRKDEQTVEIEIIDEGPGLGDAPERLFEKFVRGVSGDGRPPGAGLGLSIARGLLEAEGGRVTARNGERGGAVFQVRLPIAAGA